VGYNSVVDNMDLSSFV